jgi:hypothetical protein
MRRVAGILMIMYGVKTIVFKFVVPLIRWGFLYALGLEMDLIVVISAVFIITGGVFCLKRKYWKLCFASSLALLLFLMFELVFIFPLAFGFNIFLIPQFIDMIISLPWGILPLIFVCIKKREWSESQA